MIIVLQRVKAANVTVDSVIIGSIEKGLVAFCGVLSDDTEANVLAAVKKLAALRIFCDERGKMFYSVCDICGSVLAIPNFTLCAELKKGNRPEFLKAAAPERANALFELFKKLLSEKVEVQSGVFGADMTVTAVNDGPVTIVLDTDRIKG